MEKSIRLVGSKFISLSAKRNTEFTGNLKIETRINISSIEKVKEAKDTIKVAYVFEIDYHELGRVSVEGVLFIATDAKIIKNLLKDHEDKKYETEEHMALTNIIIQKATIKAISLEEELNLPVHIRLPLLGLKK